MIGRRAPCVAIASSCVFFSLSSNSFGRHFFSRDVISLAGTVLGTLGTCSTYHSLSKYTEDRGEELEGPVYKGRDIY